MTGRITAGQITLHLAPDEEPYNEYPKVGIVARAVINGYLIQSTGVWGIECPDLVAGCPIPEDSWVIGDYGNDQISELQAIIDVLINTGDQS